MTVHPHARGERLAYLRCFRLRDGSSPRPWGTHLRPFAVAVGARFIPTPVGNAVGKSAARRASSGSSPRPWGTRGELHGSRHDGRFIPTPVGNAVSKVSSAGLMSVHPHARGERVEIDGYTAASTGSSPRPWGTLGRPENFERLIRFIPTPVGNARPTACAGRRGTVHPHARGERLICFSSRPCSVGSSPRPWGTHTEHLAAGKRKRFIPTPVGNALRIA